MSDERNVRLPRFLTWLGVGFALAVPLAVATLLLTQPGELPRWSVEWPRFAALGSLALLPPAVAVVGLRWRRRALLGTAAALGLLFGTIAVPFGLLLWVSTIAWTQAASRLPALDRSARRAPAAVVVAVPVLLATASGMALFAHQDPACWSYEQYPDGTRSYGEAEPDPTSPSGFGLGSTVSTGSETVGGVEVDPDTGGPLDPDAPTSGRVCVSDRITVPQGTMSLLLTVSAGAAAVRLGRPRPPGSG